MLDRAIYDCTNQIEGGENHGIYDAVLDDEVAAALEKAFDQVDKGKIRKRDYRPWPDKGVSTFI